LHRFDMFVPEDLEDLLKYVDSHQSGVHVIANGTDLINRIQRKQVTPKVLADISGLNELSYVRKEGDKLKIGALTTISELISSPIITKHYDVFREVAAKFGGPSIINMATVGGNICSASSSEDLLPVLLVLNAEVRLRSLRGERTTTVEEFLKGKRATALKHNEILVETIFRELEPASTCSFDKVGMRNSLIIAFVNSAVYLKLAKAGRLVEDIRVAFNRVNGKIPQRARHTEEKLRGMKLSEESVAETVRALKHELKLTSDFRVSEEYRVDVASALFKRMLNRCSEKLVGERGIV